MPSVVGTASWYGPGFHGHRTSSGQIYNQEDLTAASTEFPLGTRLLVTNLDNGRAVEVTVNDHGPFVKGRKIDLSRKAARVIGMIGPGTADVRMDVLSAPAGGPPIGERFFVQMGSFAQAPNAERLRQRLATRYSNVAIDPVDAGGMRVYRVRMGAFPTREAAETRAASVADFGMPVVVVAE
jgi:rare lipoprotein A